MRSLNIYKVSLLWVVIYLIVGIILFLSICIVVKGVSYKYLFLEIWHLFFLLDIL
jgi:hypothetical protein